MRQRGAEAGQVGEPELNAALGSWGSTERVRGCVFEAVYLEVHFECSGVIVPGSNSVLLFVSLGKFVSHSLPLTSFMLNGKTKSACLIGC